MCVRGSVGTFVAMSRIGNVSIGLMSILSIMLTVCFVRCLGSSAPGEESVYIFTLIFVIVWCGSAIVTVNSKLLGGKVFVKLMLIAIRISYSRNCRSFFQSVCVLGYCIFPLVLAAIASIFVPFLW